MEDKKHKSIAELILEKKTQKLNPPEPELEEFDDLDHYLGLAKPKLEEKQEVKSKRMSIADKILEKRKQALLDKE